jgi:cytochrome c
LIGKASGERYRGADQHACHEQWRKVQDDSEIAHHKTAAQESGDQPGGGTPMTSFDLWAGAISTGLNWKLGARTLLTGMILRHFALSLVALTAISADARGQDTAAKGAGADNQLVFNNVCRTCHTLEEGDNRLGPNLHNIIGRKAGSVPDYGYSSAMKDADLTWDRATLDRFIANPDQVVPGNKMKPYGGLTSAEERAKIIAFLEANSGS